MTWYYADWSWLHTLTNAAAVVMTVAVLACGIVNLIRTRLIARHADVSVTNGLVQRSSSAIHRGMPQAPHHQNGIRAA